LSEKEKSDLSFDWEHSLVDKNENVFLAANFESVAKIVDKNIQTDKKRRVRQNLFDILYMYTKNNILEHNVQNINLYVCMYIFMSR